MRRFLLLPLLVVTLTAMLGSSLPASAGTGTRTIAVNDTRSYFIHECGYDVMHGNYNGVAYSQIRLDTLDCDYGSAKVTAYFGPYDFRDGPIAQTYSLNVWAQSVKSGGTLLYSRQIATCNHGYTDNYQYNW